jgi:hypothetical protein
MKNAILKLVLTMTAAIASSSAFAGGGGSGWTQCYAKELGYIYSFSGYTQSLAIGETINVFTSSANNKEYGHYKINSIDQSQDIGIIELSHVPDTQNNVSQDTDFGNMKIEYFSDSALKDIKVTFTKNGLEQTSHVTCITD